MTTPHDHSNDVPVKVTPGLWEDAPPIRTYADGCEAYGPYQMTCDEIADAMWSHTGGTNP